MLDHTAVLAVSAAGLGISGLVTLPGLVAIAAQIRNRTPPDNFYEDQDGKSTPESVAAFSNKVPKVLALSFSIVGLGLSIAISVLSILNPLGDELGIVNWISIASWALLLAQSVVIWAHHSSVTSYQLGIFSFLSSLVIILATVVQCIYAADDASPLKDVEPALRSANVLVLVVVGVTSISLSRRPDVFYNGAKVDSEMTVSALCRNTFSWPGEIIVNAKAKGDLEPEDLPKPDHYIRAETLVQDWTKANHTGSLLRSMVREYAPRLAIQWTIIIIRAFLGLVPFWAVLHLVQILERRDAGSPVSNEAWGLVLIIGIGALADQWLLGWVSWIGITWLMIPWRGQLSSLIYGKSLRRKNVKNAEKANESEGSNGKDTPDANGKDAADSKGKDAKKEDDDDDLLKSSQAIVNLVGVDANRVADFGMMQHAIISSVFQLLASSAYLITIIGWIPFGAGVLAWAVSLPVNMIGTKMYMKAADRVMKQRDKKLAVVNEALLGMRQIKFSATEGQWEKRIMAMREHEISAIKETFKADTLLFACWIASPILLAAAALAVYAIRNDSLSPSVAFVSIGIFKNLEVSLSALPELFSGGAETYVSVCRIDKYLSGPEIKNILKEGPDVAFENACISWPSDEENHADEDRFILRDLNLSFPAGELSVISGKTGSGKSLLLNALIGEADLVEGSIYMPKTLPALERNDGKAHPGNWILAGSVAYVGQTPWLESASLKDNILFGLPYNKARYNTVLDVCALRKDIAMLTDGDKTELGANGINLSGGQKWRLTLARAIYSRAEILVMDDIFSAVDAHVGREIFEKCISGPICKGRTRIIVTHHVGLVEPITKYLVELGGGTILHAGLTSELAEDGTLELIKSHEESRHKPSPVVDDDSNDTETAVSTEPVPFDTTPEIDIDEDENTLHKVPSKTAKKFVQDEGRQKGSVKKHVYGAFMKSGGGWLFWSIAVSLFVLFEANDVGRSWWVRIWTGDNAKTEARANSSGVHGFAYGVSYQHSTLHAPAVSPVHAFKESDPHHTLSYYLSIYVGLAVVGGVLGTVRFVWSFVMSIKASRSLFSRTIFVVLRTKLRWLDTVPVGRILNRLTADFEKIDGPVTVRIGFTIWHILGLLAIFVAAILVSWYMVPLAIIIFIIASYIAAQYMPAARSVKRIGSNAKSPVFENFNSSLAGVSTIRSFQKSRTYVTRMDDLLDHWNSSYKMNWAMNRWLSFRMAVSGAFFTTMVAAITVASSFVDAAMAGFALSFALEFSETMLFAIRLYAALELEMNAVERVVEYCELDTEDLGGEAPPAAWPTTGRIEVDNLSVSYADDLPIVLKNLSFSINDNERVGVIGRTGAGKSSLTLALFRFLAAKSGKVVVDGIDISKIPLHDLRSRLAIIPQDPVLFSGSIRSNLDAFDEHTDEELKECLTRVHLTSDSQPETPNNEPSSSTGTSTATPTLAPKNTNIFNDLNSGISESGGNLSQGQRQLLCIARAIVSRPKIMVLDEATSAVDMATDALIQRSIREEFTNSTLLVIAHRLSTIADFDRILVLSEGTVAEFGTPRELWEKEGGIFRDMCEHSGEHDKLKDVILGGSS